MVRISYKTEFQGFPGENRKKSYKKKIYTGNNYVQKWKAIRAI